MRVARWPLLVAALLSFAWFVLGARQAHDLNRATAIVAGGNVAPAQARQVTALLNAAGTLNPDNQVGVVRAELATDLGKNALARQLAYDVIRVEPKNLQAWLAYEHASVGFPVGYFAALVGIRRLVPYIPARR